LREPQPRAQRSVYVLTLRVRRAVAEWLGRRSQSTATSALFVLVLLAPCTATAQRKLPADSFPPPSRPVSSIVAPRWIAEDRRDAFGETDAVIRALRIRRGQVVADIGAGDGYYVAKLAPLLGDSGRVLAVDIEPRYLAMLRRRVADAEWRNVQVIEGVPHDPTLPDARVDVALMIHMYHEIEQPFGLLYHLATAMKADGLVGVLDADAPTDRHGTPPRLLRCEMEAMGYRFARREMLADGAYLAIFRAPTPAARLTSAGAVRSAVQAARCRP